MMVEGIDFFSDAPLDLVGRKALAANLSDLAAMGSRPHSFLLNIALPKERLESIDTLVAGIASMATEHRIALVGGDLSSAPQIVVSITAFGVPSVQQPLLRSDARPGDIVYVSRPLGGAAAGLELYRRGWRIDGDATLPPDAAGEAYAPLAGALLRHHLAPEPESDLGMALGAIGRVHACIDISDGLSTDLHRLCRASGVGAVVEWERIPLFPDLLEASRSMRFSVEELALHGGEEYALLFTSPLREYELSHLVKRPVYAIGRVTRETALILERDTHQVPLGDYGFDHFDDVSVSGASPTTPQRK